MVVLFTFLHQLHFGFPHASQPLGRGVLPTVLSLVLTSLSWRLIGWFVENAGQSFFRLKEVPVSSCNLYNKGGMWVECSDQGDLICGFHFSGL